VLLVLLVPLELRVLLVLRAPQALRGIQVKSAVQQEM
jgi:hypothetical protein